ncbi:hypothetical protein FQZ97_860330 [compost metagenome]
MQQRLGDVVGLLQVGDVGMHVDQAGQYRLVRPVDHLAARWRRAPGLDGDDALAVDLYALVFQHLAALHIQQTTGMHMEYVGEGGKRPGGKYDKEDDVQDWNWFHGSPLHCHGFNYYFLLFNQPPLGQPELPTEACSRNSSDTYQEKLRNSPLRAASQRYRPLSTKARQKH